MDTTEQHFDWLCRTCMNKLVEACSQDGNIPQQQWLSIFDIIVEECDGFRIAELITNAVPQIEVQPSDELPKRICSKCLQTLLSVYRFQQMCVKSEQQMRQQVSKRHIDLKIPAAATKGEIGENNADSYHFTNLQSSSTHQNLEHSSEQEPLLETTKQVETSNVDIDQLLEDWKDTESNLSEFVKNEPMEYDKHSYGESTHSAISVKDEQFSIEFEEQQITETYVKVQRITYGQDKRIECPHCSQTFSTRSNMIRHKAIHEQDHKEACDICGKSFVYLKQHKLTHSGQKPHKCELCVMSYGTVYQLRHHMRTHTGETPFKFKCEYCDCSFIQRINYMQHIRLHLGDNIYRCKLCPLAFPAVIKLREHITTHKNEDPKIRERNVKALEQAEAKLQLKVSQQQYGMKYNGFTQKDHLRAHLRQHIDEKPYKCKYRNMNALKEAEAKLQLKFYKKENKQHSSRRPISGSQAI